MGYYYKKQSQQYNRKKHMKKIILLAVTAIICCAVTFFTTALPQVNEFSTDPQAFYKEITEYLKKTNRSDVMAITEEFVNNCQSGVIGGESLQEIITVCNVMLEKRMKTYPHYANYLQSLNNLAKSGMLGTKFNGWHTIVKDMLAKADRGKFRTFEDFTEFSNSFFEDGILFKTSGKSWKALFGEYDMLYEDGVPRVNFPDASFYGMTAKDTVFIVGTAADYYPLDFTWKGTSGKITWERVGLDPNSVYCEIGEYEVDLKRTDYKIENVVFYHKTYFNRPLKGRIIDQVSSRIQGDYLYPQFESYELDIRMTNIAPQVEYFGGFGMNGAKLIGFGNEKKKAQMSFFSEDGRLILKARADRIAIEEQVEINSRNTAVSLYFAQDSIYHPNLNLKYTFTEKELRLVRDSKASAKIAFMSSYHQLEANIDAIFWKINTPVVDFKMVSTLKTIPVLFESFNLYDENRLNKYRRVTNIDPVYKLSGIAAGGQWEIDSEDFAKYLNSNYTTSTILSSIFEMVEDGFIYYDAETDIITIRQKALHYMDARKGDIDFDRIFMVSVSDAENAQLDLDTKELLITGVDKIALSDSQRVAIHPYKGITRVKKNRDMEVDGTVVAGNVDLTGKNFQFNYDPFTFQLDSVDRMQIYLYDDTGERKTIDGQIAPINTLIRDVSGTLFIDKEDNKSGKEAYPSYPRFESEGNSFTYYNSSKLYDGAYKQDTFYFKLDPFKFNDLDEISASELNFEGSMVSGNIFPEFKETIKLQEDFSLGFTKTTPAEGFPTYGKGTFTGDINMSNDGLKGKGQIDFMSSSMWAEEYVFLPDSMFAQVDSFNLERKTVNGVEFPNAHNSNVKVKWLPSGDSLWVRMIDRPFSMYDDEISFKGSLVMAATGLKGVGTMNFEEAALRSDVFTYNSGYFRADSADVVIKNKDVAKVAFNSYNVKTRVDMDNKQGEFLANGDHIPIVLPYNKYKTNASEFYWLMDEQKINLRMPEDEELSQFESTHKDQGGLKFNASGGVVDLAENTIQVDGIPFITVADARIQPNNTQITIDPDAQIRTLENALMQCDTANGYHTIYEGTFDIRGAQSFEGSGEYRYKGKGMKKQKIQFDLITTKEDEEDKKVIHTFAAASIPEEQGFKLNERIDFKGEVVMDSREPFLIFDGYSKVDLITESLDAQWFKFKDQIDPKNIQIDVTTPIGERKDTLYFGILQDMNQLSLYPTFLTKKRTPLDVFVFRTGGEMAFDDETNSYQVGDKEKLNGENPQGSVLFLDDEANIVKAEGRITFGDDFGMVRVDAAGQIEADLNTKDFKFNDMIIGVDFFFDEKLMDGIGESVRYHNAVSEEIDYTKPSFMKAATEMVDKKEVKSLEKLIGQYAYLPEKKKGLDHKLIFTDVQMVFDTTFHSIRSVGKIGLSFAGEKYVNRMMNGYIEFNIRQRDNFFNIFMETEPDDLGQTTWYYFYYKKGTMYALSSDVMFNDAIVNEKDSKKQKEDKKKGTVFQYVLAQKNMKNAFVADMKETERLMNEEGGE